MASITNYRSQPSNHSSDSDSSSEDEDQPWKRQKKTKSLAKEVPMVVPNDSVAQKPPVTTNSRFKRKRNNIWGAVVQEQAEEQVAREMTQFDMHRSMERDVESYSFQFDDGPKKPLPLGNPISFEENANTGNRKMPQGLGGSNDDAWLVDGQSVRDRLGSRNDVVKAKDRIDLGDGRSGEKYDTKMKFITINADMHIKEVAGKISYSLNEPKRDMMKTVVSELGVEKSIALWEATADIEKSGGMMVNNGSRRRTPGGVFFQLIKTDQDIQKLNKGNIFAMSTLQSKKESRKARQKKRRKKSSAMDVDVKKEGDQKGNNNLEEKEGAGGNCEVKKESKMQSEMDVNIAVLFKEEGDDEDGAVKEEDRKMEVKKEEEETGNQGREPSTADMEEGEVSD